MASIVPIAEEYIEGFRSALDSVARERRYLAFLEAPGPDDVRTFVLENIAAGVPQFVALVERRVVGWCDVIPNARPTRRHSGVLGIGVMKEYRSKGIGPALMEATLEAAHRFGLTRIELTVRTDNARAKRLYERFGFVVEGLCKRYVRVDGAYHDGHLMARVDG